MANARWSSADGNGGWRNHYRRTIRWAERVVHVCKDDNEQAQRDVVDFALAFFLWCYSLRDWLKASGEFSEQELQKLVSRQRFWGHCRDIALRSKHFDISRPSVDADYGITREFNSLARLTGGTENIWSIWIDGEKHALSAVISDLSDTWKNLLEAKLDEQR